MLLVVLVHSEKYKKGSFSLEKKSSLEPKETILVHSEKYKKAMCFRLLWLKKFMI